MFEFVFRNKSIISIKYIACTVDFFAGVNGVYASEGVECECFMCNNQHLLDCILDGMY